MDLHVIPQSPEGSRAPHKQKSFSVHIYTPYCKGCGICSEMCSTSSLRIGTALGPLGYFVAEVADAGACKGCRYCERACPDLAITVLERSS